MAESPREILRRIRGIKSTQQITRAMEMVAAVKLNRVRAQAEKSRPYVDTMETIMRALCSSVEDAQHPFFLQREEKKTLVVVLTSDRGLCGTFNVNVINAVKSFYDEKPGKDISLITMGRKGNDALAKLGYSIEKFYSVPWGEDIDVCLTDLSRSLIEAFQSERVDAVYLMYSRFDNVLKYTPSLVPYLPVAPLGDEEKKELLKLSPDFLIEPDFEAVASTLIPEYLRTRLYQTLVESLASEYAARMVAMRNATDNADEVIAELTLSYNKARQASITRDLIDIIGGVEALNG